MISCSFMMWGWTACSASSIADSSRLRTEVRSCHEEKNKVTKKKERDKNEGNGWEAAHLECQWKTDVSR